MPENTSIIFFDEYKKLDKLCSEMYGINLGGKAEVTSGYRSPREILEEVKDVFHINDVRIAITGKTSYVDAYAIDISDTEKLADIAGYISRKFTDDILYSIPISLNGSDYFFVHK